MEHIWKRIENWLEEHAPAVLESLAPGATEEEIRATEEILNVTFPADFRESYMIHDGQSLGSKRPPPFTYGLEMYSLRRMVRVWKNWKDLGKKIHPSIPPLEITGAIRNEWFGDLRIPIAGDEEYVFHQLDFIPTEGGTVGQVIQLEFQASLVCILGRSFREWLEMFAYFLENNIYVYVGERNGLVSKDVAEREGYL